MTELIRIVILIGLIVICLTAFCSVWGALFPSRLARMRAVIRISFARAFIVGLINLLFFVAMTLGMLTLAQSAGGLFGALFWLVGVLIGIAVCVATGFGITVVAQRTGDYLLPSAPPLKSIVTGALALLIGCCAPIVGWFILAPLTLAAGVGAFVMSLFVSEATPT